MGLVQKHIANQPFSNLQMELLKIYSTGISDSHLQEVNHIISRFLLTKARNKADKIWQQRGYSEKTISKWLNK